MSQW